MAWKFAVVNATSEAESLEACLKSFHSSALWNVRGSTSPLFKFCVPSSEASHILAVDSSLGDILIPTTLKSFLLYSSKASAVLVIPSFLTEEEDAKETLALLARACLFSSLEGFEFLEQSSPDRLLSETSNRLHLMEVLSGKTPSSESLLVSTLQLSNPTYSLGNCIALGALKEAEVSRALRVCNPAIVGRFVRLLKSLGLANKLNTKQVNPTSWRVEVLNRTRSKTTRMMLPTNTFSSLLSTDVPVRVIERCISDCVVVVPFAMSRENQHCQVRPPGSKSVSNRALLLAGLSNNECIIHGLLHSDDTQIMMACLEQLGSTFTWMDQGRALLVRGNQGKFSCPTKPLWMGNAGTATRFVISLCTLVADANHVTLMEGSVRMMERPQSDLITALQLNGCDIQAKNKEGFLPLAIRGGGFPGGEMTLSGKISSQYVSSVLFAAPFAKKALELTLEEAEPTSLSYIEMTIQTMKEFGVHVERLAVNKFRVPLGGYTSPAEYQVEADASSATYALAMATVVPNRTVTVFGVGNKSVQGDAQFCKVLQAFGAKVEQDENSTTVTGSLEISGPGTMNLAHVTDAFLTATAVACLVKNSSSTTTLVGIANQHQKECDRILALCTELDKLGVTCDNLPDGIAIHGGGGLTERKIDATLHTYDDHRVAMSFAVLGTVRPNLVIEDKDCTDKTYPEFWDDLETDLHTTVLAYPFLPRVEDLESSLVLIGMRGVGKTTLGAFVASKLGWPLVDLDKVLIDKFQVPSCQDLVVQMGWEGFRREEAVVLKHALAVWGKRHVLSCGGGVVELEQNRALLQAHFPVIHLERAFDELQDQLEPKDTASKRQHLDPHRPHLGEPLDAVWARREPWFKSSSQFDFFFSLKTVTSKDSLSPEELFWKLVQNLLQPSLQNSSLKVQHDLCQKHVLQNVDAQLMKQELYHLASSCLNQHKFLIVRLLHPGNQFNQISRSCLMVDGVENSSLALVTRCPSSPAQKEMFYIFGHPTVHSNSPILHNTAFALFHREGQREYHFVDSSDFALVQRICQSERFRGASVTIPFKQDVFPLLTTCSQEAKDMHAVNTIVRSNGNEFLGDNTDWLGIYNVLKVHTLNPQGGMLVVGAGGTARAACYCAQRLNLKLYVYNRTLAKAQELATEFGGSAVADVTQKLGLLSCIVSTVPGTSNWEAPVEWVSSKGLVVLDAAMRPRQTKLLQQAQRYGCVCVEGIEMFTEQGFEQIKRFEAQSLDTSLVERVQLPAVFKARLRQSVMDFYNDKN